MFGKRTGTRAPVLHLAVRKTIFNFVIGSPSPLGSRGTVRIVTFLRISGDSGPDPGGHIFVIPNLALSAARITICKSI